MPERSLWEEGKKNDGVICIRFSRVCSCGRDCWQLAREVSLCAAVGLRLVRYEQLISSLDMQRIVMDTERQIDLESMNCLLAGTTGLVTIKLMNNALVPVAKLLWLIVVHRLLN